MILPWCPPFCRSLRLLGGLPFSTTLYCTKILKIIPKAYTIIYENYYRLLHYGQENIIEILEMLEILEAEIFGRQDEDILLRWISGAVWSNKDTLSYRDHYSYL